MPDLKATVVTSATVEKMSRHDMLEWVNETVHGQYKKLGELCSGVAYCQMMELLFPHSIGLKKIKYGAKLEHEFVYNLKLFQSAFTRLNFDKSVPIDRLVKGRFQDNFEFLQWFKKFFDTHAAGKENKKAPAAIPGTALNAVKPARKAGAASGDCKLATNNRTTKTTPTSARSGGNTVKTPNNAKPPEERHVSPSSLLVLQETHAKLTEQVLIVEHERNCYYKKLTAIEALLTESTKNNEYVEWCTRALNVLYAVDNNAAASESEEQICSTKSSRDSADM